MYQDDLENTDPGKGYVLTCTKFDAKAFAEFRDTRRNKAGERYASVKDMAPGHLARPGYPSAAGVAKLVIRA